MRPDEPGPAVAGASVTHLVVSGDSLWRIARESLAEAWGRAPTDAEVVPYWQAVISVNHSRLVHPEDPDLIFPGQELLVPPVPSASSSPPATATDAVPALGEVSP